MERPGSLIDMDKRAEKAVEGTKSILKQQPPDGEWPEVSVSVADTLVVVVKRELGSDTESSPAELRGDPWNNITLFKSPRSEASSSADTYTTNSPLAEPDSSTPTADYHTASKTHPHTGTTKLFCCKHCNYQAAHYYLLKRHMITHTRRKSFTCEHCDYKTSQVSHFKSHMLTHTGEKPFSCMHCDYECSRACNLKRHMMIHTGQKSYNCKQCDFKCSLASSLKSHKLTHTTEKPLPCKLCDYKCSQASNLRIHMVTHTGDKPFSCKYCEYKCVRRDRLLNHEKKHFIDK